MLSFLPLVGSDLEALSESISKPKHQYLKKSKSPIHTTRSPPQSNRLIDDLHQMLREKTREVESLANANVALQEQLSHRGTGDPMQNRQFEGIFIFVISELIKVY